MPLHKKEYFFLGVTLLVTHYNRSGSLRRLLVAFRDLGCRFEDIVVSDDASNELHLSAVRDLQASFGFRLITAAANGGFGANINRGQDAVTTPYTLYVQEDFVPRSHCQQHLENALRLMASSGDLDYIRFWSHYTYPVLLPYGLGFSEITYDKWHLSHLKYFMYSDNPHLRRSNFLSKFGRYKEGVRSNETEYRMCISFIQKKGKGLFYDDHFSLFTHENSADEPSTHQEIGWKQSPSPAIRLARWCYLRYKWLKCSVDVKYMQL